MYGKLPVIAFQCALEMHFKGNNSSLLSLLKC